MIETLLYKDKQYPNFQSLGFASQFAIPYAKHICTGFGYDVGCMKKEWSLPGSYPIDKDFDDEYDALNLPDAEPDYIFSSHCLEHCDNWVSILDYWTKKLKKNGVLFLYLPHYDQVYWRPWNNKKHKNIFTSQIIKNYMEDNGYQKIFFSEKDLNDSFIIMGEKK